MPRPVKYAVVLKLEGDRWHAFLPEFCHITATGNTQEEVLATVAQRLQAEIDQIKRSGLQLPAPSTRVAYVSAAERGAYDIIPC